MILSVSRRTDIPRFYFDWFLNRLKEGSVLVRNPIVRSQVSLVELNPEVIDLIAFWTKNPKPMLEKLDQLEPYPYFIQCTINPYGNDLERHLPSKKEIIETFKQLSDILGTDRMIWRYSPILLTETYTIDYHLTYFEKMAKLLQGSTEVCRISFLEVYKKIASRMEERGITDVPEPEKTLLAKQLAEIGRTYGITLGGCGNLDVEAAGFERVGCIDARVVSKILGQQLNLKKDPGQRETCYCVPSVDIGSYNTCNNGCVYCYANLMDEREGKAALKHDPDSPLLCDTLRPEDKVTTRKLKPFRSSQLSFELE